MGELLFIHISREGKKSLGLTLNEYVTADSIYYLSNNPENKKKGWCYASRQYLADNIDLSRRGLMKILDRLVDKKIIEIDKNRYIRTLPIWHKTVIEKCLENDKIGGEQSAYPPVNKVPRGEQSSHVNKVPTPCEQSAYPPVNKVPRGGEQSAHNIYSNSNIDTDTIVISRNFSEKEEKVEESSELSLGSEQSSEIIIPDNIFLPPKTNGVVSETGQPGSPEKKPKAVKIRKDGKVKRVDCSPEEDKQIGEIFKLFQTEGKNPGLDYSKIMERKDALWLIRERGFDQAVETCKYAFSLHGVPYTPQITKPSELREKYGQISIGIEKKSQEKDVKSIIDRNLEAVINNLRKK